MLKVFIALLMLAGCRSAPTAEDRTVLRQNSCIPKPQISPTKLAYFKALLANPRASIDDYLVTFSDKPYSFTGNPYYTACEPEQGRGLVPGKNLYLDEACAPDVLYAWGPIEKLAAVTKKLRTGEKWDGHPLPHSENIYATLTPATAFTAGLYQLRVRLKKGVPIYSPATENQARAAEDMRPVVYGGNLDSRLSFGDFTIYDADVISGWSYGQPEQYDEIVREIKYIKGGGPVLGYLQKDPFARKDWPRFFALTIEQKYPNSDDALKRNLNEMLKMIVEGTGDMGLVAGYCPTRADYFRARKPTYVAP